MQSISESMQSIAVHCPHWSTKSQAFSDQVGPFTPANRASCAHGLTAWREQLAFELLHFDHEKKDVFIESD